MKAFIIRSLITALLFFSVSCSGGGDSGAPAGGESVSAARQIASVGLSLTFRSPDNQIIPVPDTATGNVEIMIFRGTEGDPSRAFMGSKTFDFSSREAVLEIFAGEKYSFSIVARVRSTPNDTAEQVFTTTQEVFVERSTVKDRTLGKTSAGLKLDMKYSNRQELVASGLSTNFPSGASIASGDRLPEFTASVTDQFGRPFPGAPDTVEISAEFDPDPAALTYIYGVDHVVPAGGVAKFDDARVATKSPHKKVRIFVKTRNYRVLAGTVSVRGAGYAPKLSAIAFDPAPPSIAADGKGLPEFGVKLLDQYGDAVDTAEVVTLTASGCELSGEVSAIANRGVARFSNAAVSGSGKGFIYAKCSGVSSGARQIIVTAGEVSRSSIYLATDRRLYKYTYEYGGPAALTYRWHTGFDRGLRLIRGDTFRDKVYALDGDNGFWVISGLDGPAPQKRYYKIPLKEKNDYITNFTPSNDGLSVFAATPATVYKWHRINDPEFVRAAAKTVTETGEVIVNLIEYEYNRLLIATDRRLCRANFSVTPPETAVVAGQLNKPCGLALDGKGPGAFVAETGWPGVYRVSNGGETITAMPFGSMPITSGVSYDFSTLFAHLSYCEADGVKKLYLAKTNQNYIHSYDLTNGVPSQLAISSLNLINVKGMDVSADGRNLFLINNDAIDIGTYHSMPRQFVRIISTADNAPVSDLVFSGANGEPVEESIKAIVVY